MVKGRRYIWIGAFSLLLCSQANAIPVPWILDGGLSGGFTYDADAGPGGTYSGVSITSPFNTYSDVFSGNAVNLIVFENILLASGLFLDIDFDSPLTNAGGSIGYMADGGAYFLAGKIRVNLTEYDGDATAVPEPGSLALIGAGLLSLVWIRRRRFRGA